MTRDDKKAVAAAIACVAIFSSAGSLILPTLTLNLEMRGEKSAVIGALGALLGLATLAAAVSAPPLVRRWGAKRMLCGCLLTVAVCDVIYKPFADSTLAWFALYSVAAFGVGLAFILSEAIIASFARAAQRGLILGMYVTGFSVGFAVGPIILTFTGVEGWAPFLIGAGLTVAAAAAVAIAPIEKQATPSPTGVGFWRMFPEAPLPFVCAFAVGAAEMSVYDLLPVYARKIGFSVAAAVFLLTVFSLGTMMTQAATGALSDKFGYRRTLAAATFSGALGAAAIPWLLFGSVEWGGGWSEAEVNWARMALLGLWGGSLMAIYPLGLAEAAREFPPPRLVSANSLFGFGYGAGALFGPLLTGMAMDAHPDGIAPMLTLFAALPLLVIVFFGRRKNKTGGNI